MTQTFDRVAAFCSRIGVRVPVLLAPMSGVPAVRLSAAVANAGGLGACGVLMMKAADIAAWAAEFRSLSSGPFQLNEWIPDPPPRRDAAHEDRVRAFLAQWGPPVAPDAGNGLPPDFATQCEAMLGAAPPIVSSVMGLYPDAFVKELKSRGIIWFANISTVEEARMAEAAGADVVVAQGSEAGGHRGAFDAAAAERRQVGLFSLLPAVVDAVGIPVVATGGIADGRGVAAALALGASAVQVGTAFLRTPEAGIDRAWADALATTLPEQTMLTRAFSGRAGRSIATRYVMAAASPDAPSPAPYPVQRGLSAAMRADAQKAGDVQRMQAWAGQSAMMAQAQPAGEVVRRMWEEAQRILA
jgi:nitronate monooxygenase